MNILEKLVIPFVGPGCCHDRACKFYWYEFYHLPVEGCPSWESYKKDATVNNQIDSKFDPNLTSMNLWTMLAMKFVGDVTKGTALSGGMVCIRKR